MRRLGLLFLLPLLGMGCGPSTQPAVVSHPVVAPKDASDVTEQEVVAEVALNATTAVDPAPADASPLEVDMSVGNFFFEGERVHAAPGQEITIHFSHVSGEHTFVIDELDVSYAIQLGGSVTFNAPEIPGSYTYYCDTGSHRKLGMEGVLVVE